MNYIFVSHGDLAKSILGSTQMIIGEQSNAKAFGLYPKDDIGGLKDQVKVAIEEFGGGNDIICFTDLFSGSPFNAVVSLMGEYPIHHVTGMNLPMVLEAFMARMNEEISSEDICSKLLAEAPATFIDVNKYLDDNLED
ncbi:TPA: PTS sugar transporter subunit IIA [Enterococcus faecium]|uniref:PTS sugar transporter subunit IIA n=1 Tax=Enterococcus lactis TaxID=357441 RepID=UPI00241238D8|nr:PTS sugar transporter subunit IIA [Enterococcus lactis]HAQ4672455.1 PTS sugar transporter subunit IIA [Enterococcus faecium]HAQ4706604.1 PTS sugar transporter subunit IIA [Enterococcus faecium]HAR1638570.1 PTS sugar transporter subunit IIA [Enterococcus faecium]